MFFRSGPDSRHPNQILPRWHCWGRTKSSVAKNDSVLYGSAAVLPCLQKLSTPSALSHTSKGRVIQRITSQGYTPSVRDSRLHTPVQASVPSAIQSFREKSEGTVASGGRLSG